MLFIVEDLKAYNATSRHGGGKGGRGPPLPVSFGGGLPSLYLAALSLDLDERRRLRAASCRLSRSSLVR